MGEKPQPKVLPLLINTLAYEGFTVHENQENLGFLALDYLPFNFEKQTLPLA